MAALGVLGVGYATVDRSWLSVGGPKKTIITAMATRASMPIVIVAGGELESFNAVEFHCQVEGQQPKIIEMLSEGAQVKQGQLVMRLDPSEVNNRLAQQQIKVTQADALAKADEQELQIQKNLTDSQIAQAELAVTLAALDKKKYLEGDYVVELNETQGALALAQTDLQEAQDTVEYYRDLVKKGFRTPEQLRAKEQSVERAKFHLERDKEKLHVLRNFTRERQSTELTAKAEEAVRELERVKSSSAAAISKAQTDLEVATATARLEHQELQRIEQQLVSCTVLAPADGTLVYANSQKTRIELGAAVHFKQKLFSIPDMSVMQVKTFVHESEVQKVQPGMPAEIRIDAYSDMVLKGAVTEVATFYDSTRHWLSGGVKEYATSVKIVDVPDVGLKPGMTAQVNIRVAELVGNLIIPIAAVAEKEGQHYCFVVNPQGVQRRSVEIGSNTDNFVEITAGLQEGEQVALDAWRRATSELESTVAGQQVPQTEPVGEVAAAR